MSENHDPVVAEGATPESGRCPIAPGLTHPTMGDANREWWPNKLNLKILAANPADTEVSYWLGIVILQERKSEKQVEALYDYARAVAYDGPGATITAAGRDIVKQQLSDLYVKYHGSTEGFDAFIQRAKASANPPADLTLRSAKDMEEEQLRKAAAVP